MIARKRLLWLVSWYPNQEDPYIGDFIQRHAIAAALYHDIHVIFVKGLAAGEAAEMVDTETAGLTEQRIYFVKKEGVGGRLYNWLQWQTLYKKAVKAYIKDNGKPDGVHVHVPWKAGLIALWLKKRHGLSYIVTEHWGIYNRVVADNVYTRSRMVQAAFRQMYSHAAQLVSVSRFLAEGVLQMAPGLSWAWIPNVADTALFFPQEQKEALFTFIHVSDMTANKNVDGLLTAFGSFAATTNRPVQLLIIGNKEDDYAKKAEEAGLLNKAVFFGGEIAYHEVAAAMRKAHCFVLNSRMENSPCVIGEALCCGLPVITTNVGGVPELVSKANSLQIPPGDNAALAGAMRYMVENYAAFDQAGIAAAAAQRHSYGQVGAQFSQIYASVF